MKVQDSLLLNNIVTQNPILARRDWFLACCITLCPWVFKAHIDVSQPFTASKCRLTKNWGFGSLANMDSDELKGFRIIKDIFV